jgi:gamma-glutamyl-gamma-aminobutyrate hydrolase PuuD
MAHLARAANMPVLAICGGMQALNVAFGGSLYQDIAAQRSKPLQHKQPTPATRLSHDVTITSGSLVAAHRQDWDDASQQLSPSIRQGRGAILDGQRCGT